jgi:hypothetical protein
MLRRIVANQYVKVLLQVFVVCIVSTVFTYVTTRVFYGFSGYRFNMIWSIFFPGVVAITVNDTKRMQIVMLGILMFLSFFTVGFWAT